MAASTMSRGEILLKRTSYQLRNHVVSSICLKRASFSLQLRMTVPRGLISALKESYDFAVLKMSVM